MGLEETMQKLNMLQKNMPKYRQQSPEIYEGLEKKYEELLTVVEQRGTLKMYKLYNGWLEREKKVAQQK